MTQPDSVSSPTQVPIERQPIFTPEPTPTLTPLNELEVSLDRELCLDYCWHGIMIGQTQDEAIQAIQQDPWTDKSWRPKLRTDDYIAISRSSYGTQILWIIDNLPDWQKDTFGKIIVRDGIVSEMRVPFTERQPLQIVLDELGEPDYVRSQTWDLHEQLSFWVHFVDERVTLLVRGVGQPPELTANGNVLYAVFFATEQTWYHCNANFLSWEGFGGPNKYYFYSLGAHDFHKLLVRENLPEDCE